MSITQKTFGKMPDGTDVYIFKLTNSNGCSAEIINYGGIVVSLMVPDRNGKFDDVTLGFDHLEAYFENPPYLGALIGRFANRIEDSKFEINCKEYTLAENVGKNHLHGGLKGFDKVIWDAKIIQINGVEALQLSYLSKDGEENYPGNLDVKVIYSFTDEDEFKIDYFATTDQDTVINLTNHAYFNLSGHASGDVLKHKLMINADKFTVSNAESIPTGEIANVKGTPMDFTTITGIAAGLNSDYPQIVMAGGYDHNWVLNVSGKEPELAAEVYDPTSGRIMQVFTTKPGVQLYTGNYLDGSLIGKGGVAYEKRSGLCLETQYFPNSIKLKHFPSPVLRVGEEYRHTTVYKFSV